MSGRQAAVCYTAAELIQRGREDIPSELVSSEHLIYNSPAALSFNSPGAEGYGVKRAGLTVPGSVMLLVAPGCCGRNTSLISAMPQYEHRFFYLMMDETDLVTGRHLDRIPQAVEEVVESLPEPPSVVMVCITCVDALLGTDMERVCRKAEARCGLPVRPCYMYALTREGRKPPMVQVRQAVYSLLEPGQRNPRAANLLGFFGGIGPDSELFSILNHWGVTTVRQAASCETFEEYQAMSEANFNLVLHPEARVAAADLQQRLGIPWLELARIYRPEKIRSQYRALGKALGRAPDDEEDYQRTMDTVSAFQRDFAGLRFAVGETLNADPFELALCLLELGFGVGEIYAAPQPEQYVTLRQIAARSPDTLLYSNLEPTMLYYDVSPCPADVTLGKDAAYYQPTRPNLPWNSDLQPFGYAGLRQLLGELRALLEKGGRP